MTSRLDRTRSSMLWAAWADALGFISELTTSENLRRRTQGRDLTRPMPWSRNVGGRMGVRVDLPEGCYSDDTQLRLATSRSINSHGFDIEAFSRVELTVWPSYALGGGRASKSAATAMAKQQANWANNHFNGWQHAGGNGAAMRIQPHVYASRQLHDLHYIDDVIRNSVVTHGHPRGIVGAVFHAIALAFALDRGKVPGVRDFGAILGATHDAFGAFKSQPELASYWLPQWERSTGTSFDEAWRETVAELDQILQAATPAYEEMRIGAHDRRLAEQGYEELVQALHLDDPQVRGSGTLTSAAALLLASAFPDHPAQSAQIAASRLHTDTDTIGTMAAAIVGAAAPRDLWSPVLDQEYLAAEATRLHAVSEGRPTHAFPYPDLLLWQPPKSALEATGMHEGALTLAGLSALKVVGDPTMNKDGVWVWARTTFGQSVLVKHRHDLRRLPLENCPVPASISFRNSPSNAPIRADAPARRRQHVETQTSLGAEQPPLFDYADSQQSILSTEGVFDWLERRGYRDADVGRVIKSVALNSTTDDMNRIVQEVGRRLKALKAGPGNRD